MFRAGKRSAGRARGGAAWVGGGGGRRWGKWGTRRKGIFTGATCHRSCLRPRRRTHTADTLARLGPLVRRPFLFLHIYTHAHIHIMVCVRLYKYTRIPHIPHVTAIGFVCGKVIVTENRSSNIYKELNGRRYFGEM